MEITKKNFADELGNITYNLNRSCFVGFDAEFTALLSGNNFKYRFFDTNEERYNNIKNEANEMIMSQVGLTMFQYDRDNDGYNAISYTFHLCPQVFGDTDQKFTFQASTLKFLCKHNFNFNKFIYEGIPYLSKMEEDKLHELMQNQALVSYLTSSLEIEEENQLQNYCSEVSRWLNNSEDETMYIDEHNPIMRYLIHIEVRLRFSKVLTTNSLGNSNKVIFVVHSCRFFCFLPIKMAIYHSSPASIMETTIVIDKILIYRNEHAVGANNAPLDELEYILLNSLLGFSNIIKLLEEQRKPLIGHNLFMDIILLHNQFIGPLPKQYLTLKNNVNRMFPVIFDTKLISHEMSKRLAFKEVWKSNSLQDLYEFFSEAKCKKLENGLNSIKLKSPFNDKQSYHEAGWDSYCTGYCFIRLAHWAACENIGKYRPIGPTEKLTAMEPYCNKVNVIRGAVPYMSLIGRDPPRHRPGVLYVKSLKEPIINLDKVACALAGLGAADVRPHGSRAALVAAGSHHTADKILKTFHKSREYRISTYKAYRHSPAGRFVIWSGALITGGLLLVLLHKRVKQ